MHLVLFGRLSKPLRLAHFRRTGHLRSPGVGSLHPRAGRRRLPGPLLLGRLAVRRRLLWSESGGRRLQRRARPRSFALALALGLALSPRPPAGNTLCMQVHCRASRHSRNRPMRAPLKLPRRAHRFGSCLHDRTYTHKQTSCDPVPPEDSPFSFGGSPLPLSLPVQLVAQGLRLLDRPLMEHPGTCATTPMPVRETVFLRYNASGLLCQCGTPMARTPIAVPASLTLATPVSQSSQGSLLDA